MKITKWDLIEELATEDDIINYLSVAFEDLSDKEYIRHALAAAMEAIRVHGLSLNDVPQPDAAVAV